MGNFQITEVLIEYLINPRGIDETKPCFQWKTIKEEGFFKQTAYRIQLGTSKGEADIWDSGMIPGESQNCHYNGSEPLKPCTEYYVALTVWDEDGDSAAFTDAHFETGLMDDSIDAWEGARFIGAPEKYVRPERMGVFTIRALIRIPEGSSRAGIVFGANDARLMDARKNMYGISGENYIRYEVDISKIPAVLRIYRVGYHPDDSADTPFAVTDIVPFNRERSEDFVGEPVITSENRHDAHELKIELIGNCAFTYMDDILVDAEFRRNFFGQEVFEARQLNPLGANDVPTFPRLCETGYYAGPGDEVFFPEGIVVRNIRTPKACVIRQDEQGFSLKGGDNGQQKVRYMGAHSLPMFRRRFDSCGKKASRARLYITARGIYECDVNGKAVTDTYLNPGASQYDKHLMYQVYDVTDSLNTGDNEIHVTLGSGWWCDAQTFVLKNYNYYGDRESFMAKLCITYEDGSEQTIVSDTDNWEYYGEGPYIYSGLFYGEHFDARRHGWEDADAKDIGVPVEIVPDAIESYRTMPPGFGRDWPAVDHSNTKFIGGMNSPVYEVCRLKAVSVTSPREGLYIYDLGQEIAGAPCIRFHGERGEKAVIRYGEMLYPDLPAYSGLEGMMLTENYRDAESIDVYILNGDAEGETFRPRFTFHGFRYIQIMGVSNPPALEEVEGIQLSSVREITGTIETSDPLLNRFIENVTWSQLCNFISIPTDCPQRNERMGWAGDTHVFCRTAVYRSDVRVFYDRYLQMLQDLQEEDGQMPEIAPVGGGFGGITYECAMIFMVWELYQHYGTMDIIEKYYDSMCRFADLMHDKGMPGMAWVGPINDWLAPEKTDDHLLWNAFYYRIVDLLGRMAKAVGKNEDAEKYLGRAGVTKEWWNNTFVDPETGKMRSAEGEICDTQCAYALPLAYGVVDDQYKRAAYDHLAERTRAVGCTVQTGFFGTGVLNPMLSEGGHSDLAYVLMRQTAFPSWLYSVTQGATTIWERWDSFTKENGFGGNNFMNSFNHYSLGSVVSWIYEWVLGIQRDEEHPGYRHFYLRPQMQSLDYARGGFETPLGRIESSWEKTENGYRYECTIPCGATVDLILESGSRVIHKKLTSGRWSIDET